jgi:hypothetical protein
MITFERMKFVNIYKALSAGLIILLSSLAGLNAQPVPGTDENIPFLVTFGKDGDIAWGDPTFSQTFFFAIPKDYKGRFYIRVFDPDVGGLNDEQKGVWDTKMLYSVYGGKGVDPEKNEESRGATPTGNYKSGTLLQSKIFGAETQYDNKYYSFGPFIATQGDFSEAKNVYYFKIICGGISGDDGNLYRYFLSKDENSDIPVEGANAFTYAYTFRMWNDIKSVSHIYPYIDTGIVYIKERNFDWDSDGEILVVSKYRIGYSLPVSGQKDWKEKNIPIESPEIGSSLDFQFHKRQDYLVRNNNVQITLENQRGDGVKFYSSPIGGIPVYKPDPVARQKKK